MKDAAMLFLEAWRDIKNPLREYLYRELRYVATLKLTLESFEGVQILIVFKQGWAIRKVWREKFISVSDTPLRPAQETFYTINTINNKIFSFNLISPMNCTLL